MEYTVKSQCAVFLLMVTLATISGDYGNVTTTSPMPTWTPSCNNGSCHRVGENVVECQYENDISHMFCPLEPPFGYAKADNLPDPYSKCKIVAQAVEDVPGYCGAVVGVVCPAFGPVAGGTHLSIWGQGFEDVDEIIYLSGIFACYVRFSNSTLIECVTNEVSDQVVGSSLSLEMTYRSSCSLLEQNIFTFRRNPAILSLRPMTTIVSGGVALTVRGVNLDSVAYPILHVDTNTSHTFSTVCKILNSTAWSCPYPDLRRPYTTSRNTRATSALTSDVAYRVGFSLDGVTSYRLLSSTLGPGAGTLAVVDDPLVDDFHNKLMEFRPAWPDNQETITMKGSFPPSLLELSSVWIRLGSLPCEIRTVSETLLSCKPPVGLPAGRYLVQVQIGNYLASPGQLVCDRSAWGNRVFAGSLIGVISVAVLIIILLLLVVGVRYRCRGDAAQRKLDAERASPARYLLGDYLDPGVALMKALSKPLQKPIQACRVPPDRLKEESIIQTGHYGQVGNGWILDAKGRPINQITFKGFKEKGAPFRTITTYLEQALPFRGLQHENLLPLLGVSIVRNTPTLLYAYMEHGDLKQFLVKIKEVDINPEVKELLQLAMNAADGMAFLLDKGHLHGDLAARTCRVDSRVVLRICDSALAQDLYPEDYQFTGEKQAAKPIKWMAPEHIEYDVASAKTEVWSFGVLLWEIMTLGETPYNEMSHTNTIEYLRKGNRLPRPHRAPVALYTMMTHCWAKDPNRRQTFRVLSRKLLSMITGQFRPNSSDMASLAGSGQIANGMQENLGSDTTEKTSSMNSVKSEEPVYATSRKKSVQFEDVPAAGTGNPTRLDEEETEASQGAQTCSNLEDIQEIKEISEDGVKEKDCDIRTEHSDAEEEVIHDEGSDGESEVLDPKNVPLRLLETDKGDPRPDFKPSSVEDASVAIYF